LFGLKPFLRVYLDKRAILRHSGVALSRHLASRRATSPGGKHHVTRPTMKSSCVGLFFFDKIVNLFFMITVLFSKEGGTKILETSEKVRISFRLSLEEQTG